MKLLTRLAAVFVLFSAASACFSQSDTSFKPTGLEQMSVAGSSCTGFWETPSFKCTPIKIPVYLARANDASRKALVIINGNAGGVDRRHGDYARYLADHNINAMVLDSFMARGHKGGVTSNLNHFRSKGLDGVNMTIDALTVAADLSTRPEWAETKIGYLGESMSGSSAIGVTRPYMGRIVEQQSGGKLRDFDAVVGLYAPCFERNTIERFKKIPLLLVMPEKDDTTPAALCKRQVEWMNARGGNAQYVELADEHHDFDGPWALKRFTSNNTAGCANTRIGDKFVMDDSKKEFPGTPEGYSAMREQCTTSGFHSGHRGKERVGYEIWLAFFQNKLLGQPTR